MFTIALFYSTVEPSGGDARSGATDERQHRSWWAGLMAFDAQYVIVVALVIVCAVLTIFLVGVLCIVRKDLTLRPPAAANRSANKRADGVGARRESTSEALKGAKRLLSPLLATHLDAGMLDALGFETRVTFCVHSLCFTSFNILKGGAAFEIAVRNRMLWSNGT